MDPLFAIPIPEDWAALSAEDLQAFIDSYVETIRNATADPKAYVTADRTSAQLIAELDEGATALVAARAELAARPAVAAVEADLSQEDLDAFAAIAETVAEPAAVEAAPEPPAVEPPADAAVEPVEPVTAAADPQAGRRPLPLPGAERRAPEASQPLVALTAAGDFDGMNAGDPFPSMREIALAMQKRRGQFGLIPEGTRGEKVPIVRAAWADLYPTERRLGVDGPENEAIVAAVLDQDAMRAELARRRRSLTAAIQDGGDTPIVASGGLCAPVTPYYQLQMISQAMRPVRAALPAFNADRGGIRFARPASLSGVTTGVGHITAAQDGQGAPYSTKTCQVVPCPEFQEIDVEIIFHCLQFGNLGARTFPERVTQWNNLTLAAHARLAESLLLTGIDTASTQVTAASLGLGATATIPSVLVDAACGLRSRNRMDPEAVLRVILPSWVLSLLTSDMYRTQFQRFDMSAADFVALLRENNIEPSFHLDGAAGRGQVYGVQNAGPLLPFPANVTAYLYPEGSFLYLDGGTLELGLVRDSVLNANNDFQIFGETFEAVAFVGVESLAIDITVCDSGTVTMPNFVDCPINYHQSTAAAS